MLLRGRGTIFRIDVHRLKARPSLLSFQPSRVRGQSLPVLRFLCDRRRGFPSSVFNPERKEHRWGRRKLARDRQPASYVRRGGSLIGICLAVLTTTGLPSLAKLLSVSRTRKNFSASMGANLAQN